MKINVGTGNVVKIQAVKDIVLEYSFLTDAIITSVPVSSSVGEQPKTLHETILGAKSRAIGAFNNCDLSVGIEDGLMTVPETKTGYMNVCCVAIFDGITYHLGLSSAFESPSVLTKLMIEDGIDMSAACKRAGLTNEEKIGNTTLGVVGLLTKSKINRVAYTRQALIMALVHLDNKEIYEHKT